MGNILYSCIKVNIETVDSLNIYIKNDYNSPKIKEIKEIKEHRFQAPKKIRSISPIK